MDTEHKERKLNLSADEIMAINCLSQNCNFRLEDIYL